MEGRMADGPSRHPSRLSCPSRRSCPMQVPVDVRDFDFDLPPELIAQDPAPERTAARLLYLCRETGALAISSSSTTRECFRRGSSVAGCRAAARWSVC